MSNHHRPGVPLARLLPRVDDVTNAASDAFWSVVADRFPEIDSGDMDPLTIAGMHTTFKELIESWLDANWAWRPAVGQRVAFVREVQRFTEFTDDDEPDANPFVVVAAGTTGVVTVCSDDVVRVRLDEPLDGAEVLDNEISWGGAGSSWTPAATSPATSTSPRARASTCSRADAAEGPAARSTAPTPTRQGRPTGRARAVTEAAAKAARDGRAPAAAYRDARDDRQSGPGVRGHHVPGGRSRRRAALHGRLG